MGLIVSTIGSDLQPTLWMEMVPNGQLMYLESLCAFICSLRESCYISCREHLLSARKGRLDLSAYLKISSSAQKPVNQSCPVHSYTLQSSNKLIIRLLHCPLVGSILFHTTVYLGAMMSKYILWWTLYSGRVLNTCIMYTHTPSQFSNTEQIF